MSRSSKGDLTGIERELVLQYLIDGNVPVTVTLFEGAKDDEPETTLPVVFPVALKSEQLVVLDKGIILLKNPPASVKKFSGKKVKVEFYFNRLGLYFITEMRETKNSLALVIPAAIKRVSDDEPVSKNYDFTAVLYYSCQNKTNVNIECVPTDGFSLFTRPVWSSIATENQSEAKKYLEGFVADAHKEKHNDVGIHLIPICKYIVENENKKFESLADRTKPLSILFVDHERLVLACDTGKMPLVLYEEYGAKMSFRIGTGPIATRDIFVTCCVKKIYTSMGTTDTTTATDKTSGNGVRAVADCGFTSIQEEDMRFLYEKATSKLFI